MSASYDLKCPVARALDVIGERWTIPILRDLFREGPRKFADFEQSLDRHQRHDAVGAPEEAGRARHPARRFYAEHPPRAEYLLTQKGRTLGPILKLLLDWGTKHAGRHVNPCGTPRSRTSR